MRTVPATRQRIRDLAEWVRHRAPGAGEDLLGTVTRELGHALGTDQTFAYGLDTEGGRTRLTFLKSPNAGVARLRQQVTELLESSPAGFAHYDPRSPPPGQRNAVVTLGELRRSTGVSESPMLRLLAGNGLATRDQLRVLICDGPSLLAYVGALRDRPFGPEECGLLRALVRPLRDRLTLDRRMEVAGWAFPALEAALDALGAVAVVVRRPLRLLHCNAAAQALLERDRAGLVAGLREELDGRGSGTWTITSLGHLDGARHFLALRRRPPSEASGPAAAAGTRYGLTPRQVSVLELVARGEANKTIAAALACSEGAVEQHVSGLFRRYGVECRAQLVARFWTEAG